MNETERTFFFEVSLGSCYNFPCLCLRLSCEKVVVLSCSLKNQLGASTEIALHATVRVILRVVMC